MVQSIVLGQRYVLVVDLFPAGQMDEMEGIDSQLFDLNEMTWWSRGLRAGICREGGNVVVGGSLLALVTSDWR